MKFYKYLLEKIDLPKNKRVSINLNESNFSGVEEFTNWFKTLTIPKRKPKSAGKLTHSVAKSIEEILVSLDAIQKSKTSKLLSVDDDWEYKLLKLKLEGTYERLFSDNTKEELEQIYGGKDASPKEIKGKFAVYQKFDSTSYDNFLENMGNIEKFLSSLKGYHKKALKNGIIVRFVDKTKQKSIAKYLSHEDVLQINPKRVGNTKEEYGGLLYIVLHELGHRYLKLHPQKWDIDTRQWGTTKYSYKESFTGEEKFAELFAMSHWERKYSEYKDTMDKFKKIIE